MADHYYSNTNPDRNSLCNNIYAISKKEISDGVELRYRLLNSYQSIRVCAHGFLRKSPFVRLLILDAFSIPPLQGGGVKVASFAQAGAYELMEWIVFLPS